jgi:hypothetical protein
MKDSLSHLVIEPANDNAFWHILLMRTHTESSLAPLAIHAKNLERWRKIMFYNPPVNNFPTPTYLSAMRGSVIIYMIQR